MEYPDRVFFYGKPTVTLRLTDDELEEVVVEGELVGYEWKDGEVVDLSDAVRGIGVVVRPRDSFSFDS